MPSPELQATIDSFDYRSYLKMKGLSDEEIPETLSPEAKQKIYSRAYSEYVKNEIKALQAETPGGMSPTAARKEIEERELEESPHLRPLWGYWEKELTAEDVYRPEMLFPILKEKYGIDVTDPDFDIEKLGEKGKISLDEAINTYTPNIVNKQTRRNVPELEGITRPEFAKQFRERNALLQGDTVESFLTQYKKTSEAERLAEDEQKRSGLDYWSDLGEQAYIQGRQMLYGNIAGFAQSLVQDPRIPFTNIRWDGASPGTDEGNTLFNRTLLDLAAWGTRKHAEAMRDGEKKDFVPRYLESPPEYLRQGEWGKAGGALMEQMVLNGASTVQNMLTPAVIAFGNRVITPVTGAIGSVIPGAGTAAGVAVGRGITAASVAGLMVAGGLMTASDVVADLHEYGIYDQSKVDAYLEHIATAVALDSTGTLIDAALMGGGRIFNAIPFIRNRSETAAKKAALDAATRANGLDPALVNKLAGRQLLRNQSLRRQANAKIWGRGGAGWSVLRRTGLGALQEGWSETQQEAINMDLLNKMTSFDQEGNWNPGLAGFVWPFAWEQANREGGYRFPEKMVRHRLETAGSVGAAMGGITVGIGSTYNQWQSAKARAALDKANTVTDAQGNSIIIGAAERQREAAKRVFADMQNQGKGVNAATIAGVNLNQVAGVSVANFNGITGTGTDATEAFIDLTMRANAGRKNIDDSTLTAVAGGHEVTLANGEKLTFLGTNSEQMLRDLVNLHNSDNHPLTITGGATIEYTPGANKPFKITRTNGVTTNVETLYDNYAFYNFSTNADSSLVMDSILRRTGSQSAESTIGIDITQTGAFSFTGSEQAIRNSINNSNGRLILLDSAKTKKGSTARVRKNGALQSDTMMVLDAEDGVIYTIKLKGGRNNSNAHVNVTARDLGGRRLTLDPDVAKQTIRSAADPSALRNQIRLKSPKAGIIIQGEQVAGSPLWHFKADQIDEIARRTGASVLRNTSNYVEFQLPGYRWTADGRMEEFGTSFALRLDDQGKVWADSMGTSIEIEGINDYQAITPGETNLYAHALQGGKYTTASIDQNTGAITMRRTAPSGAEVEVVLGRRGTIDSYRIVENNAQQLQNMIDAAIAARNARTAQQQATQQQMGQIVDPDLTTYTSQEIAAAGFDPLTINQRLKAILHAQIAGHIWSPISTFEGIRNIIQGEFGFPMNRLMVRQAVSETGTVNGWSIRNINDEEIGFFNNDTQGLRDFKAFMTDDVINDMFALDRLTPYLLEQLMNNPQRAIFDLTGTEYKAAVNKFFAYHDAVFRPQTDTSQMTRSTDRRLQVQKSVHIQIDEVINGRVVLPDIAAVRAFYGDLIEQGYGVWDKVSKKFIEDRTTGKRQYGDRTYAQALAGTNPQLTIRYLYKLGNEYYTENELVKAAHDKKNFDLLTDDVINDMIEKRLQGMQERPLDVAARGNRRYIDILNETIFREVRKLLDSQYDSIDELINYYGGNLVRRQTFRVHTAQGYMYVGKDDQLYSVQQVQNDPNIQELVTFDSTQYPSQYWTATMGARKYADIYQLRNDDGSLLLNEHVNLRTTDGRSAVPQATVDANLKRITDRLRGKDILIQYFNTFATNDSINDQIIDEDNEPEIPGPDRSQIETDVRNRLKTDAANAQTIMDFFEIYGHQVQERFAVLDTSNGLYAGRTGNSTMLGVDTFLTQSELAEYIQKNGLNQNQTILEYYVFYNNDLSVIHSFNTMSQEDSFMNELRRPDKVDLIDITKLVDDEFQAEEVRVGQQKAKREALRNQRAALASGIAQQAATGGGPTPPSTGPIGYADYLTRLFGANSFVNLNAKVELFDGNLTGIMDVPIEDFYWEQNMANAQGEQVRDINDPARSLDGELNRTVGKLWRDAKRRGLVQVHKTVVEFLNSIPTQPGQPSMRDEQLERIVRGMLGVELQKPQPQVTQAEIQARINSLSTDEQNELLRKHFTPQGYYEVVPNPGQNQPAGRIHFIEENIPWGMGDRVFYHEVGVHASLFLQGEIAGRWRTIIQYLKDHEKDDTDLGKAVRAIIRNRGKMGQKKGTFGYWEEVSAYFVADNLNKVSFAARIKAMFKDWFRLSGIVSSRGDITTADIVRFARASTEVAISRSNQLKTQRARGMEASATFSMMGASFHTDTETVRDQYEAVRQHYDNAHYSHMFGMVHDKLTGLPNYSNLDGTHWVFVRTPVFKKWFGDWETRALNASKIVDTAGEPLLIFHNTKYDHEAYDEPFVGLNGNFGHSGQSIYGGMTENPYAEKFRGNTVAQTFVNMRRPLHMHNYEETARYMEALGYEQSARRLDLRKLAGSVRNDPRLRAILKGIEDYAADPQPGTSFADFMLLNDNLIYEGVPLTNAEEAHRFLNGLFEAATTPANSTLTNEPVLNANTVEEWQETLDDEETRAHWRQAADIFETRLKPYENQMLRLAYNPDGYFTHYQQAHDDLSVSTRERVKDVLSAVDQRYYGFGERDMIEFRQALMDTYAEISQLPESSLSNDELFVGMVNMSMHNLRMDELNWRLGEDLDFVTTPAYPVPTAQSLLKEHNRELAVSLKSAMMRDGYDGILGTEDILVMHPDQSKDVLEFKRLYPEKSYNPTRGLAENPVENRVVELLNDDINRDAKVLGVPAVRLRSEYRSIYRAFRENNPWSESNLDEYQWILTRTPSFKENFGDWQNDAVRDMVLDTNGEPLRTAQGFIHGTGTVDVGENNYFSMMPYNRQENDRELRRALNEYEIEQASFNEYQEFESQSEERTYVYYGEDEDGYDITYYDVPTEASIPDVLRDNYGIRFVADLDEAELVQKQYEKAMSRQSDYIGNLYGHLLRRAGLLYEEDGSYLAGFNVGNTFILSHFAPKNLKAGAKIMRNVANGHMKVMAAVPEYQGQMLEKVGFRMVGQVPQIFNNELVSKNVYANNAVGEEDINEAYQKFANGRTREEINELLAIAKVVSGRRENNYFSMFGRQGAARLLGTPNYELEAQAEMLEAMGKDPDTILLATGYRRDKDGHWRYEVSNIDHDFTDQFEDIIFGIISYNVREKLQNASRIGNYVINDLLESRENVAIDIADRYAPIDSSMFTNVSGWKLSDIFSAPEIYKAYPGLADIPVTMKSRFFDYNVLGSYDPTTKTININPDRAMRFLLQKLGLRNKSESEENPRDTMLHEIQHYIQEEEGLPGGTGPVYLHDQLKQAGRLTGIESRENELRDAREKLDEFRKSRISELRRLYSRIYYLLFIDFVNDSTEYEFDENDVLLDREGNPVKVEHGEIFGIFLPESIKGKTVMKSNIKDIFDALVENGYTIVPLDEDLFDGSRMFVASISTGYVFDNYKKTNFNKHVGAEEINFNEEYKNLQSTVEHYANALNEEFEKIFGAGIHSFDEAYYASMGEVEASAVEKRANLTQEELLRRPFEMDMRVAPENQIDTDLFTPSYFSMASRQMQLSVSPEQRNFEETIYNSNGEVQEVSNYDLGYFSTIIPVAKSSWKAPDELDAEEYITLYRATVMRDGKYYSPMAEILAGEPRPIALGEWEYSVEHPELIVVEKGKEKFKLIKKDGTPVSADYAPYIHSSLSPLNDQFTTAYRRPIVILEIQVPKSEETAGYQAERSKKSVGWSKWKSGPVASKLGNVREVMLSRYAKPTRPLTNIEVAERIREINPELFVQGKKAIPIPINVVTPGLLRELIRLGATVGEPSGFKTQYPAQVAEKERLSRFVEDIRQNGITSPYFTDRPATGGYFSMSSTTPQGLQKQEDVQYPDASQEILGYFSLTEKRRARYRGDLERAAQEEREGKLQLLKRVRPDLTRGFIESVLDELETYGQDADKEKMVLHWTIRGRIIPYVDRDLINEARAIVKQKKMPIEKVLTYESPMALIDEYKRDQYKPSEEPIDPESMPEIKKDTKINYGNGIVSYEVQDDKQGQEAMRRIVNSHFGKKWSKWCLLYANMSGELTDHSWEMWQTYSGLPKRAAFKDGRLISFMGVTREQTGIYSIDQIITELYSIIEEDVEDDIDTAMMRYNLTQDEADLISEVNDLDDLFIEINRFITFIMSLGDKDNHSSNYMYFDMIIDSLISLINSDYFNDNISNIRSRYPEIEDILRRFGEINVNTSGWDASRADDYFKFLEFKNPNMIERWKDFADYFRTGFRTMLDRKRADVRRIIDHIYYVDEDDDLAVIRDRDGELVDLSELNYNVENEFHYQDGEFVSRGNGKGEEWYDKNDHSHPNLDWARDDRTLTRIDMGIAVELIQQMNEDEDLIGPDQDDQEWFSMMRRRDVTNYDTDIYDRTEIVGSNGAYKLKNGKIFIDVNQVGQENVARVLLYALVRENQDALNNPVMGRMLSFIQAWEHSQDPRLRGLYADIRMDMMNDHVPDTALLAYAVRRMMADGVNPTNPQAEDTPEGVFAGIIGEVPNIIGQVGGVSTSQVNATTADIVTVVNAISGVENVSIDVAVPSMGLTEAQMQAAYTRPVPFMDAIMAEVKEIVDRYDGASFDYIDGKPHLILGGQGGMVLNLSDNPLFAKNVVDQLMEKLTDFGNFDTMTTDPNAKPGDPGNPFTEIIQKIGTNSQLGTQATEADVNKFINENLPAYIADRIQVIYNETDEYKALFGDTYGALYRPVTADRKVIFVRAYGRNLSDVIGSIVNMTSYFGWTQYNNADFAPLMDELWTVLKHNIQNDLPTYYAKLNGQTPTTSQKSALISAYLAAKSTSIYELAEFAKTSNVAPNDEQRMLDIAKKVKDEITKVELSMAASFARDFGVNKEAVQEYTEKLLRMTMAPFYGRGMWFAYDVDYDTYHANNPNTADRYKDFGHVMVFANDFGPVYKSVPFSEDALTNKIMLQKYRQVKPVWKKFHLFLWRNWHPPMKHIGETTLGIQNTIALNRAYRAVTTEFGSALKTIVQDIQAFDDAMIRKGIDVEEFDRAKGYVQELKDRGITDRKLLEQAEVLDVFLRVGREKMLTNVTDIRALIRDSAMEADTWMRHEGVPEKEIQKMHMEMDRFASRFVTDWEHRSYRAYMEEGQNDLQEMWNILDGHSPATMPNGSVWFSNAARQARQDLTRLEQDKARGVIGEQEYAEKRKEFRKTVKMYERLDALYHWVNQNVMANLPRPGSLNYSQEVADVPRKVNAQMKQEIENVMTLVSSEKARGNLGKMDLIPAVRKRKLNENNPHDVLYMTFLDQIKNPAMAMVYNLDQQGKVLDKLIFNLQFGRSILQSGMGTIKGSREHVNLGVDNLSWMETGTLLRYIKVDPFFLDEIRHEQEIQLNLHDTVFGDIIQIIKQNFTILNWRMMISNYLGNVSNLVATGHFFRFKNWMAGHAVGRDKFLSLFVQSSKKATNVLSGKKGAANVQQAMQDYEATIAEYKEEMEKLNIWGSGTTTIDLTRYGRGGIEKVSELVSGILETTGMIDEVGSRAWNRRMNRGMNIARELYGFGDEWVKTLTYINNRAVAVAKYRAQENWAQYAGNEASAAAVAANNRIMEMAKREAAILTMKETTTWELGPDFARQISASPIRVISPDFLLHSFQMARIMAVNVSRIRECAEEVARLRLKPSLTEDERLYLGLVTNELIRRTIGQSMMLWIGAEAASYGGSAIMGLLGSMLAFMRGEGDDDDERRKRRNRKKDDPAQMSPGDHTGLSMLCNYVSQVGNLYTPLMWVPGAVGDKFYALNFQRMNAALTLLPVRPAKVNPSFLERMEHIMWELIDLRSDTLSVQLANTLRGKDRYGNDLTKSEVLGEMVNYVVPQGLHQARNVALGIKDMVLGTEDIGWEERKRNRPLSIFDVAGVKVRQYSVNDMIEQVGRRISNLEREYENPYKRKFFQKLQRDLDMSDADIAAAVSDMISVNKKEMERINYAMEAFRLLNIDRATLIKGLTTGREKNTPNLGNRETAFLLAGRDVLTERLKTNLQTKMKALQNPVEGSNMSDTERRKIMDNYRRAYRMISEALR